MSDFDSEILEIIAKATMQVNLAQGKTTFEEAAALHNRALAQIKEVLAKAIGEDEPLIEPQIVPPYDHAANRHNANLGIAAQNLYRYQLRTALGLEKANE